MYQNIIRKISDDIDSIKKDSCHLSDDLFNQLLDEYLDFSISFCDQVIEQLNNTNPKDYVIKVAVYVNKKITKLEFDRYSLKEVIKEYDFERYCLENFSTLKDLNDAEIIEQYRMSLETPPPSFISSAERVLSYDESFTNSVTSTRPRSISPLIIG